MNIFSFLFLCFHLCNDNYSVNATMIIAKRRSNGSRFVAARWWKRPKTKRCRAGCLSWYAPQMLSAQLLCNTTDNYVGLCLPARSALIAASTLSVFCANKKRLPSWARASATVSRTTTVLRCRATWLGYVFPRKSLTMSKMEPRVPTSTGTRNWELIKSAVHIL